jgi:phosphoribosylformylglycinamidine synthase
MRIGIIVFPGSNCDRDLGYVMGDILGAQVNYIWHKATSLEGVDAVMLPGGFSFGDYLRSGAIARFSPIMEAVQNHAEKGKLVLGICNGFQILCESNLLPGALLHNISQRFICRNTFIAPAQFSSPLTRYLEPKAYSIPIAHGEGRYHASEETLHELEANHQILFRYCNASGEITPDSNPNGSAHGIAGICNVRGNVMGMMPHPERAADNELGNTDGVMMLKGILQLVAERV